MLNHLVIDIQRGLNDIELLGSAMFKMINVRDGIPEMEQEVEIIWACLYLPSELSSCHLFITLSFMIIFMQENIQISRLL